jgi:hypothetical protein
MGILDKLLVSRNIAAKNPQTRIADLPQIKRFFKSAKRSSQQTASPDTSASMSITLGGNSQYSVNGGTRLYLGGTDTSTGVFDYLNIDCTQACTFSMDVNISTLRAGTVFALYLVSMQRNTDPDDDSVYTRADGTTYYVDPTLRGELKSKKMTNNVNMDPEWGIGYRDAQGANNTIGCGPCIEIDLVECTRCGIAATTHGILSDGKYDTDGSWQNGWGSMGTIDGLTLYQYDPFTTLGPYGPGPDFLINNNETFNISCSLSYSAEKLLTMIITLSQGDNSVQLAPEVIPGFESPDAIAQLKAMSLVCSLWITSPDEGGGISAWLDGRLPPVTRSFAALSTDDEDPLQSIEVDTNIRYYDLYSTKMAKAIQYSDRNAAPALGPVFVRMQNISIIASTTLLTNWAWSLDYSYRGMFPNTPQYWTGAYGNAYGVAIGTGMEIDVYNSVTADPTSWNNMIKTLTTGKYFAEGSHFGTTSQTLKYAQDSYPNLTVPSMTLEGMSKYNVIDAGGVVKVTQRVNKATTTSKTSVLALPK